MSYMASEMTESTSARLRRVEQELAEALQAASDADAAAEIARDELLGVRAALAEQAALVEDLQATLAVRTGQLTGARVGVDFLRAELTSAQSELNRLRAARQPWPQT